MCLGRCQEVCASRRGGEARGHVSKGPVWPCVSPGLHLQNQGASGEAGCRGFPSPVHRSPCSSSPETGRFLTLESPCFTISTPLAGGPRSHLICLGVTSPSLTSLLQPSCSLAHSPHTPPHGPPALKPPQWLPRALRSRRGDETSWGFVPLSLQGHLLSHEAPKTWGCCEPSAHKRNLLPCFYWDKPEVPLASKEGCRVIHTQTAYLQSPASSILDYSPLETSMGTPPTQVHSQASAAFKASAYMALPSHHPWKLSQMPHPRSAWGQWLCCFAPHWHHLGIFFLKLLMLDSHSQMSWSDCCWMSQNAAKSGNHW